MINLRLIKKISSVFLVKLLLWDVLLLHLLISSNCSDTSLTQNESLFLNLSQQSRTLILSITQKQPARLLLFKQMEISML